MRKRFYNPDSIIDNRTEQALYKIKNFKMGDFEKNIKEVMKKFK